MRELNKLVINGEVIEDIYLHEGHTYKTSDVAVVTSDVVGRNSSLYKRTEKKGTEDTLTVVLNNEVNRRNYEEALDYLVDVTQIGNGEELEIGFTDVEFHSRGYFNGVIEVNADKLVGQVYVVDLSILYTNPYKYSNNDILENFNRDTLSFINSKEETNPKITALSNASSDYLSILNTESGEVFTLGNESGSSSTPNSKEGIGVSETRSHWDTTQGGSNSIQEDGNVFRANSNGTRMEYGRVSGLNMGSNFEITTSFRVRDIEPNSYGESRVILKDENGNEIVEFGVRVDSSIQDSRFRARAVPYLHMLGEDGEVYRLDIGEMASHGSMYKDYDIYMKVERRGDSTILRTWRYGVNDGRMDSIFSYVYNDRDEMILHGGVNSIEIGFGGRTGVNRPYLGIGRNIEAYRLRSSGSDSGSVIQPLDVIEIDSEIDLVTINGEPVTHRKDVHSDYLKINKGRNTYEVYPRGVFETDILYKERKL